MILMYCFRVKTHGFGGNFILFLLKPPEFDKDKSWWYYCGSHMLCGVPSDGTTRDI